MTSLLHALSLRARALSLICSLFIALTPARLAQRSRASRTRPRHARSKYAHSGFRRCACLVMVAVMFLQFVLFPPEVSHAAVKAVSAKAANYGHDAHFWWHSSGWAARAERIRNEYLPNIGAQAQPKGWDGRGAPKYSRPAPQAIETQQDRERKIARIKIFPGDVEVKTGEQVVFSAIALDNDDNPVGGLDVKWDALDEGNNQPLTISSPGTFVSDVPGEFILTAEVAGRKGHIKVKVTGELRSPNVKSRSEQSKSSRESRRVSLLRAPVQGDQSGIARRSKQAGMPALPGLRAASAPMATRPALQVQGEDWMGWNSLNNDTADDVGSERGRVDGRAADGGAGSGNFQFAAPAVLMDGRGIDLNLFFHQNSRVWHKAGSEITFDIDRDTLIPGWNLGFGKIVMAGDSYMLIDSDGTRHPHEGTLRRDFPSPLNALQSFEAHTTDGTFIDYYAEGYQPQFDNSGGKNMILAWAVLPNGTRIEYGAKANYAMYPTRITDAHGNFITITYRYNEGPNIETITDTLGRAIYFRYDGSGLLTSVLVPKHQGGGYRAAVRLQYQWLTLSDAGANYGFASGLTTKVRQNAIPVIRAIYYPGTGTGYWFGDGDSYSPYGMIRKVSERRGMTFDDAPWDQQGNIGPGVMSREMVYNYPQSGGAYGDMPTYTQMVEDWDRRATDAPPVTYFSVVDSGGTRTITITRPDGAQLTQVIDNNQSSSTYGLLLEDSLSRDGAVLGRSKRFWQMGAYNSPRLNQISTHDERGRRTSTVYTYDSAYGSRYNSVTDVREYGYGSSVIRRTHFEYLTDGNYDGSLQNSGTLWWKGPGLLYGGPNWQGSHIFDPVSMTEVYVGENGTRLSRAEYQYDERDLTPNPGVLQHNITYNPYAPEYDPRTRYRGDVTKIKGYANAVNLDQGTAVVETRTYDVAGNLRAQANSCCEETSLTYTNNTQYAWPESHISGSPSDPSKQNTSSASYDYWTGLVMTSTDANGRVSQTVYDSTTLRPVYEYSPTGAYQYHIYNDQDLWVVDLVYEAGLSGGNFASRSDKHLDGMGRAIKEVGYGKDYVWDVVETKFDNLGRVWRQSRPYRAGAETPLWSAITYDSLGRPIQTAGPDGSVVTRAYNQSPDPPGSSGQPGPTVKVTDPWGRERWARSDALGRLVEVAEPNPGGNGSLSGGAMYTTYSYDELDRLLQVNQGGQTRQFRYDSLGRLTHQKLAERDATLNDNGQWVGSGLWSDVFTYDNRSNLTQRADARGVKTIFKYKDAGGIEDPLNRLLSVIYDKSGVPGHLSANISDAPNVSYGYVTSGNKMRAENMAVSNGMGAEQLSYDSEGRLAQVRQTFSGREGYPILTNYLWDSLDRLKESAYPQQYGAGEIRKKVEPAYDMASRIESVKFGGVNYASNPVYNAASQTTSLDVGALIKEIYGYDSKTGLMTGQQVKRGADLLVDLKYNYTLNNDPNNNGPKTGQLTSLTDLKNQARNRAYEYDKLGRLLKAKGGANAISGPAWEQIYNYDRYGNKRIEGSGGGSEPTPEVWFDDSPPAGASLSSYVKPSATVAMRSSSGYYVVEERGEAGDFKSVNANRTGIGPWETFRIIDLNEGSLESGDQISLLAGDVARHVVAGGGGIQFPGEQLYTTPYFISKFTIRRADGSPGIIDHDTDISLQHPNGYYVVAEGGGAPQGSPPPAGQMFANRTGVGPWETFRLLVLSGSTREGSDESWEWMTSNPIPYSGAQSHRSKARSGVHQHYFWGATQTLQVNAGDKLFAYVYLDPGAMPSEIMLQWNENGSWEHRAYWGSNNIGFGTDGTASRWHMGPLPQAGGWVKLEVPASAVGLEGKTLNGMAFTLHNGQAWWDKAGKASGGSIGPPPNPVTGRDGFDNLTYNALNNRIVSPGFEYDPAGNQTRAVIDNSGTQQQYRYDCANRLIQVSDASGNILATYAYGAGNQRLMSVEGGEVKYFAWDGGKIIAEYEALGANALIWKTSYVYLGGQLLATTSGAGETETRFHHPDRLGTRLVTDDAGTVVSEQLSMPFGTMLPFTQVYGGENSYQHPTLGNPSKKRFTTYDRSDATGLDYAVNRFYSPQQGRFTQVDPIGMGAAELANPQSLNLYAYVENDPVNSRDPLGLDGIEYVFRSYPVPTGGGGGGGLRLGPFSFSFSFGGGSFLNFGSLQQSKKKRPTGGGIKRDEPPEGLIFVDGVAIVPPDIGVETGSTYFFGLRPLSNEERLNGLQEYFDILGFAPGIGAPFSLASGIISLKKGDYAGFGFSMVAMLPSGGWVARAVKRIRAVRNAAKMAASAAGQSSIVLRFTQRNLQKGFGKHGADWGLTGNWNLKRAAEYSAAINQHVNSPGVRAISGSYRWDSGYTHYLNPQTRLNVVVDSAGNYVTGYRLDPTQLNEVLTTGNLW